MKGNVTFVIGGKALEAQKVKEYELPNTSDMQRNKLFFHGVCFLYEWYDLEPEFLRSIYTTRDIELPVIIEKGQ